MQLVNKGVTRNGTKYRTVGTRMSGDQNTGLGNSILNYAMLSSVFGKKAAYYIDGDDSVVICESVQVPKLDFSQFGMSTKAELAYELEKIEFCQCRPVEGAREWVMARNPMRALRRLPWVVGSKHLQAIPRYIKSVGMCELALNPGVPVLQAVGQSMLKFGSGRYLHTDRHWAAKLMPQGPESARFISVPYRSRLSYENAWGISPDEQLEFERMVLKQTVEDQQSILLGYLPSGFTL